MTVKDGKIVGMRDYLERKVKYISKVDNIPQDQLWKAIYDIALREITLIYG
jgi:hypothetical protein